MQTFPKAYIIRHRRENLKKCSLRGLEGRPDLAFLSYPNLILPRLDNVVLLSLEGEPLSRRDQGRQLLLLDGTWRYAERMFQFVEKQIILPKRTLPSSVQTAYPRKQDDCPDPTRGLASVEALFIAYQILGWDSSGLLDHYYWKNPFISSLDLNSPLTG